MNLIDIYDEELVGEALAEMISEGFIFVMRADESDHIELLVNCNDLFAWALADCEPVRYSELGALYNSWKQFGAWG